MKSILSVKDINKAEFVEILDLAKNLKKNKNLYANALSGKIFTLLFEKPSTRTRVSYESGIYQLDGKVIFLGKDDIQLSRGETFEDTGKILSKYVDCIIARVYNHDDLIKLKKHADIPIINALSDLEHPTQIIADVFTMYEERNFKDFDFTLCYTGDCNNVCNSLILASEILNFKLNVATPEKFMKIYEKNFERLSINIKELKNVKFYNNPGEAINNADFVYTDVWISMGEKESYEKIEELKNYKISNDLLKKAKKDCKVMHCMPMHLGMEIDEDVAYGKNSIIFTQAENKIYVEKAIILKVFGY